MKQNFIKFSKESVKLARIIETASNCTFDTGDVSDGVLVIGFIGGRNSLAMGWLRGMTPDKETGEMLYEIVNAVEGDEYYTTIRDARRVVPSQVPLLAAICIGDISPVIGSPFACNGDKAKFSLIDEIGIASTEFIYRLEPLFKETK